MSTRILPHPKAHILTILLWGAIRPAARYDLEEETCDALEVYFRGYTDERKADLFARIVERIQAHKDRALTPTFFEVEDILSACLRENAKEFPHG